MDSYIRYYLVFTYGYSFIINGNHVIEIFNHLLIYGGHHKLTYSDVSLGKYCNLCDQQTS